MVLNVQFRCCPSDSMLVSRSKRVVRATLEKWQNGVDEEEDDENVVYVETSCSLLLLMLLRSIEIIELISALSHTYALKFP